LNHLPRKSVGMIRGLTPRAHLVEAWPHHPPGAAAGRPQDDLENEARSSATRQQQGRIGRGYGRCLLTSGLGRARPLPCPVKQRRRPRTEARGRRGVHDPCGRCSSTPASWSAPLPLSKTNVAGGFMILSSERPNLFAS